MEWYLVINKFLDKKFDIFIISFCLVFIGILITLYNYLTSTNSLFNSKIIVISDSKFDIDYDLGIDYYLMYEDIEVDFYNSYNLSSLVFPLNIIDGREIKNNFEILVSKEYKNLLNEKIVVKIRNNKYSFLVVGIYDDSYMINNNYIFSNLKTFDILYEDLNVSLYKYVFVTNDYNDINTKIDLLKSSGYRLTIYDNENLNKMNNYNVIIDVVILFIVIFLSIIFIFIVNLIF